MSRRKLVSILLFALLTIALQASAQSRSVTWEQWDVVIDNIDTAANHFEVAEIYRVSFTGTFRFGSVVLATTNLEAYDNIEIYQDDQLLQESCSGQLGTFCIEDTDEGPSIIYYFFQPLTDISETFRIEYTVIGALRVYSGGDQLWWAAIPSDHFGFPIESSMITVRLPEGFAPRAGIDPVATYGAPSEIEVRGTTIIARAIRPIGGQENFEIRVQYPHDPNARMAAWQVEYDRQRGLERNGLVWWLRWLIFILQLLVS